MSQLWDLVVSGKTVQLHRLFALLPADEIDPLLLVVMLNFLYVGQVESIAGAVTIGKVHDRDRGLFIAVPSNHSQLIAVGVRYLFAVEQRHLIKKRSQPAQFKPPEAAYNDEKPEAQNR